MTPTATTAPGPLTRSKAVQLATNAGHSIDQANTLSAAPNGKKDGKSTTKSAQITKDAISSIKLKRVIFSGESEYTRFSVTMFKHLFTSKELPGDASTLVLLRCRQIQRLAHSKVSSPFKSLITPEYLARANFAQSDWTQKHSEDELDWVPSWIYNARALRGVLNSTSFKALPLPDKLHVDQDTEPILSVGNPPQSTLNGPLEIEGFENEQEAEATPLPALG